ncbi:hypothetical protein ACGFIF_44215 [Kribbella sp. NPDC049174]|uniref:hypothetical protein n=1 Tax=Kribbella sp. NPDC049174 TaxID=3364112 RepID=UPI00371A612D
MAQTSPDGDTSPWAPLSRRTAGLHAEPVEDVPDWLYPQLQEWLYHVLQGTREPVMVLRPGSGLTDITREIMLRIGTATQPWLLPADDPIFLDALDATVRWSRWGKWILEGGTRTGDPFGDPNNLEQTLAAANSAWRVNTDWRGLERRVNPTVTQAVTTTIHNADAETAGHLAASWEAAYGRRPDPDKAYAEAVKAVEAAACPRVLPASATATLGTVRDHLRAATAKWELVLPGKDGTPGDITPVVAMMTALWDGQRSRHAGTPTARRQDQAEAAIHLAATLVQWLSNGAVRGKV